MIQRKSRLICKEIGWLFWEIVEFYNLRGGQERLFDEMNNNGVSGAFHTCCPQKENR